MHKPVPQTMPAVGVCDSHALTMITCPVPTPGATEVLIKVAAAGLNRADLLQRDGLYPPPPGASDILGLEAAGEIVAIGTAVTSWQVGERVTALLSGGGYAHYVIADAGSCLPIPDGLTMVEAASLPETFFTVWSNLFGRAHLKAGESLLVHGGTSGIGTTAIQIARNLGMRVITTARTAEKCHACLDLGAHQAINYSDDDFVPMARAFGGLDPDVPGVDVILDMVGGDYVARNIKSLAPNGRLVNIAFLHRAKVELNLMTVMLKGLTITGSTLRARPADFKAAIARDLRSTIWPLLEKKTIKPVVYQSFPLEKAAQAHDLMQSSDHIGKIILTVGETAPHGNTVNS